MNSIGRPPVSTRASRALMLVAPCIFLLFVASTFKQIRTLDEGHLVYALDDPYIHLALSEQIAHGHYGINPGEPASPSSSILWPFLLAPLAGHASHIYLPLALNIVFGSLATLLIAYAVNRWRIPIEGPSAWWIKLLTVVLLMFTANLVSLTFVGMEHVLQVFLSITCAVGLLFAWDQGRIPAWCLAAAAIAPMVRYEDLSLTLAVSLVLAATHHKRKAVLLFIAGVIPLVVFALFLRHLGLPMLPTSVLVKGAVSVHHAGLFGRVYELLRASYHATLDDPTRWPVLALGIILAFFCFKERDRTRRAILFAAVVVAVLQLTIGAFGWFNRYEIYALIFLALIYARAATVSSPLAYAPLALSLLYLASPYISATNHTPQVTREIYRQQFQMHRFIVDFYGKDVAMNDIGVASFQRRPPGLYILDVVGLASVEAANTPNKTAAWLESIVARHHVELAILYPRFFQIPASWTPLGKMCDLELNQVTADRCVVFYATSPVSAAEIRNDLVRFVPTLPQGVKFEFDPPRSESGTYIPPPN
jgi:hypothetical protein